MASCNAPAPTLTVYGVGTPRTLRVHWALHELGCRYTTQPVTPRSAAASSAPYRLLNPIGKVPTLVDGDFTLSESGAIVGYLLRRYGQDCGLQPPDDAQRQARYDEWACLTLMELDGAALYVMRRHLDLAALHGASPVAVDAARAYAQRTLGAVEARLAAAPYLMGPTFSGVDILLTTCLEMLLRRDVDLPPALSAYRERTTSRLAYRRAVVANSMPGLACCAPARPT